MHKSILPFCLFFMLSVIVHAGEVGNIPLPKVDERVELLGIVFRLAGAQEYQCTSFKEYDDAINAHFAGFKNHLVVKQAKMLRHIGIGQDAVIAFGIHLDVEDGHVVLPDKDSEKTLDALMNRWKVASVKPFAKALDDFYVKSRFREFFEKNTDMYQKIEAKIKPLNEKVDYGWFKRFYGTDHVEHFRLILCLTSEDSGYGAQCRFKDGHEEYYAILGVSGPETKYREDWIVLVLVHEFNHSFCNPLIDKYIKELEPAAERLFPFVAKKMTEQAYPSPSIMLCEYLVRACVIRYFLDHEQTKFAKERLEYDRQLGFLWIKALVDALGHFSKDREHYPTLESFMPEIVKLQNLIVTEEYLAELKKVEENGPKIVSISPVNGSKNVDPTTTEISITFDRPMQSGMAWCTIGGNATFPKRSKEEIPKWSEDRKTCTMYHVELESGKTYEIWLNSTHHDSFRSDEDIPLEPVYYTFTTESR